MAGLLGCSEFGYRIGRYRLRPGINQMLPKLKQYLARVKSCSRLDPTAESTIVRELQTHFEDEIGELCQAGFSTTEAADVATSRSDGTFWPFNYRQQEYSEKGEN
jgi:hypothetical protein